MKKRNKIIYWASTGFLSLMLLRSAVIYFIDTEQVGEVFSSLGYSTRMVIPLAILKLLGVIAICSNINKTLKEWAYFGLLLDFVLALEGHLFVHDGIYMEVFIVLILWIVSYVYSRKLAKKTS